MMKKDKCLFTFFLIIVLSGSLYGQDRKDIRDKGIVSMTINEYFIEEGLDEPLVESTEKYNEDGEVIELKEFNKRGDITKWEKYTYDEDRNLIEEIFLDARGKVNRTEKSFYEEGFRVEKHYFNERDKLYKKKVYVYEYSQ
jgi:hypothetical protein